MSWLLLCAPMVGCCLVVWQFIEVVEVQGTKTTLYIHFIPRMFRRLR